MNETTHPTQHLAIGLEMIDRQVADLALFCTDFWKRSQSGASANQTRNMLHKKSWDHSQAKHRSDKEKMQCKNYSGKRFFR